MDFKNNVGKDRTKKDIIDIYELFISKDHKFSKLSKKDLIDAIYQNFFNEGKIINILAKLTSEEIKFLEIACKAPIDVPFNSLEKFVKLDVFMLGYVDNNSSVFYIYDEVKEFLINKYLTKEKKEAEKENWVLKCACFSEKFYQYTPVDIFMKLIEKNTDFNLSTKETIDIFKELESKDAIKKIYYDDAAKAFFNCVEKKKEEEYLFVFKKQKDKDFYIPSKEEIEEIYNRKFITSFYYVALFSELSIPFALRRLFYANMYLSVSSEEGNEDDYVNMFAEMHKIKDEKELSQLKKLVYEACKNTRKILNRGFTDKEVESGINKIELQIPNSCSQGAQILKKALCLNK